MIKHVLPFDKTAVDDIPDVVRRSNETIAIHPSQGKVTLLMRRLFNILLFFAQQDGIKDVYRRPLGDIMAKMQFGSNRTDILKDHLRAMRGVQVEWNNSSDEGKRWGVSGMISEAEIIEMRGIGTFIEWSLPPKIRERLLDQTFYTRLSLQIHSSLRSGASIALYEICSRYATNPSRVTLRAPWEWWRPRITGNPDDADTNLEYKYFKRDVLKLAIMEINTVADFTIELLEYKNGKRVSEIQFAIAAKTQKLPFAIDDPKYDGELLEQVIRIGIAQSEARKLCASHAPELVRQTLQLTESRAGNTALAPLNSKVAYFRSALSKRFVDTAEPALAPPVNGHVNVNVNANANLGFDKAPLNAVDRKEKLQASFAAHQRGEAFSYWKEMDIEEQKNLLDAFVATEPAQLIRDEIRKRGLAAMPARTAFTTWLAQSLWGTPSTDELLAFAVKTS